jgi:hypothetical protein
VGRVISHRTPFFSTVRVTVKIHYWQKGIIPPLLRAVAGNESNPGFAREKLPDAGYRISSPYPAILSIVFSWADSMPPRSRKSRKLPEPKPVTTPVTSYYSDLSFPVPYHEQQRYLELADLFLALDEKHSRGSNVIPIASRGSASSRKAA